MTKVNFIITAHVYELNYENNNALYIVSQINQNVEYSNFHQHIPSLD